MRTAVISWLLALCLSMGVAQAAGPLVFATIDRSGWPNSLTSSVEFDSASRGEILMFAKVLLASEALDESALKQRLGVRQLDLASVNQVRQRFWELLLENYRLASQDCDGAPFCPPVRNLGTCASWRPVSPATAKPPTAPGPRPARAFISSTCTSNCGWRRCFLASAARSGAWPRPSTWAMNWRTASSC